MGRSRGRAAGAAFQILLNVLVLLFGLFWCAGVASSGAWFMLLFGLFFMGLAIFRLVMCIRALRREKEQDGPVKEADPWNRSAPGNRTQCPTCGARIETNFQYCPTCGRRIS